MSWRVLRGALAFGLTVLIGSACSASRLTVKSEERKVKSEEAFEKKDSVVVAVRDSVTITKTITITENERGDTIKVVQVTERDRVRDRDRIARQETKTVVVRDTVVVVKDSVVVKERAGPSAEMGKRTSTFVSALRWIFGIIVLVIILVIILKFRSI